MIYKDIILAIFLFDIFLNFNTGFYEKVIILFFKKKLVRVIILTP